jgi:hypothetical protein
MSEYADCIWCWVGVVVVVTCLTWLAWDVIRQVRGR